MKQKAQQRSIAALAGIFFFFFLISQASAIDAPILPTIIKGDLTIDSKPAPIGTTIIAEIDGIPMGVSNTTQDGRYIIAVGGGFENNGKYITLYINNIETDTNITWSSGSMNVADLAVTDTRYYVYASLSAFVCFVVFMASRHLRKSKK